MNQNGFDIPSLLKRFGILPKKSLGQNFLTSISALNQIIQAANLTREDVVLEIGAGIGNLTRLLAAKAKRVVAVELDSRMLSPLEEMLQGSSNVEIVHGDILKLNPDTLGLRHAYKVVANIPYYITSILLRHLLESKPQPSQMIVTVQRDVAKRICAAPGEMNLLALSVQVYGSPHIAGEIPSASFYPPPEVDSSIVAIPMFAQPMLPEPHLKLLFRLAKAGFSQKRKTLRNSLSAGLRISTRDAGELLEKSGIDPMRRAETLSLLEWKNLTEKYNQAIVG
jgi:16S rRNA (adenine1518-N6/adenine1519-N6)-dimethyltransferase